MSVLARQESIERTVTLREQSSEPMTDLAARCRAGDLGSFEQVYAQHERQVFRYAYHLLGSREDADDIKQETFVRAYQALTGGAGYKGEGSLTAWLLKICGNLCRDRLKSRRRHPETALDPNTAETWWMDTDTRSNPHDAMEQKQARDLLYGALRSLPEAHRDILVLRELEELRYEEIASVLGCSLASVKLRLFRARRLLKTKLSALMDDGAREITRP